MKNLVILAIIALGVSAANISSANSTYRESCRQTNGTEFIFVRQVTLDDQGDFARATLLGIEVDGRAGGDECRFLYSEGNNGNKETYSNECFKVDLVYGKKTMRATIANRDGSSAVTYDDVICYVRD